LTITESEIKEGCTILLEALDEVQSEIGG